MRYLTLFLALIGASPAWGGMAADRMFPVMSKVTTYATTDFEDGTTQGWAASDGSAAKGTLVGSPAIGTRAYKSPLLYSGQSDGLKKIGAPCGAGVIGFSASGTDSAAFVKIRVNGFDVVGGSPVADGVDGTGWRKYTGVLSGGSGVCTIEIVMTGTNAGTWAFVDNIFIPQP